MHYNSSPLYALKTTLSSLSQELQQLGRNAASLKLVAAARVSRFITSVVEINRNTLKRKEVNSME
jgi:hypothetical protein